MLIWDPWSPRCCTDLLCSNFHPTQLPTRSKAPSYPGLHRKILSLWLRPHTFISESCISKSTCDFWKVLEVTCNSSCCKSQPPSDRLAAHSHSDGTLEKHPASLESTPNFQSFHFLASSDKEQEGRSSATHHAHGDTCDREPVKAKQCGKKALEPNAAEWSTITWHLFPPSQLSTPGTPRFQRVTLKACF